MRAYCQFLFPSLTVALFSAWSGVTWAQPRDAGEGATEPTEAAPAEQPAAAAPAPSAPAKEPETKATPREAVPHKSIAIEVNPLGTFIGRYSINVEWLPSLHHALVLNPHYDTVGFKTTSTIGTDSMVWEDRFSGGGAELGYRYYTGMKGPNGFFIGPSALLGYYATRQSYNINGESAKSTNFGSYGFAVDIGGQGVIGPGFVVGGGFGLQYTKVSVDTDRWGDLPVTALVLVGGGLRPRFLFSVGYAF